MYVVIRQMRIKVACGIRVARRSLGDREIALHYPDGPSVISRVLIRGRRKQKRSDWAGHS